MVPQCIVFLFRQKNGLQIVKEKEAALFAVEKARQAEHAEKSFIGRIGKISAPLFAPLGIDWRGGVALLTGFVAKEIVVSTLGVLHAVGNENASEALANALRASGMTPLGYAVSKNYPETAIPS